MIIDDDKTRSINWTTAISGKKTPTQIYLVVVSTPERVAVTSKQCFVDEYPIEWNGKRSQP